jgi:NhaP-type Na+/H+ or K+/H+ antiporter
MTSSPLLPITGILVLGVLAQWVAWRVRVPSILVLLATGVFAGPIAGWIEPDTLFGPLTEPLVSLSVGVILYEGGLNLKLRELRSIGRVFLLLITVGAGITWLVATIAARYVLRFEWSIAVLLGAILVVTGPTVIGPILRHLRLRGRVGALLKWEGIMIDPMGATLAVLVFTVVEASTLDRGYSAAATNLGLTLVLGVLAGGTAAGVLMVVLSRFWAPDSLHNPISLMLMFTALTISNLIQAESGLLAVTVMGLVLANQKWVSIRHVVEFKETLTVLLISCLFIVLASRLRLEELQGLGWRSFAFVGALVVVGRPLAVFASTWRSALTWRERAFLAFMAPRGIVAAAISSVFALGLVSAGYPRAVEMVPVTFLVVFVTVSLYGLGASTLAGWLGLTQLNPQGALFVGADGWARALAVALRREGCPVFLIDTDWDNISQCRMAGLPCLYGSALAEATRERIDYTGLGRMLAVTSNNEVNSLACLSYAEDFSRQEIYQLPFSSQKSEMHEDVRPEHRGRFLVGTQGDFIRLKDMDQVQVRATRLSKEFDYASYRVEHGQNVLPIVVKKPDGSFLICTEDGKQGPKPGDTILAIIGPDRVDQPS